MYIPVIVIVICLFIWSEKGNEALFTFLVTRLKLLINSLLGLQFVTHYSLFKDVKLKSLISTSVVKYVADSLYSETDAMPVNG